MNLVRFQKPDYNQSVNHLFGQFFNESVSLADNKSNSCCSPAVNIQENVDAYNLEFLVPGYSKEDFEIKKNNEVLSVSAKVENEKEDKAYKRKEFFVETFERKFKLPENIEEDSIKASYNNGILNVAIFKKEVVVDNSEVSIPIE